MKCSRSTIEKINFMARSRLPILCVHRTLYYVLFLFSKGILISSIIIEEFTIEINHMTNYSLNSIFPYFSPFYRYFYISLNKSCSSFSISIIFREFFKSAAVSLDLFNNTAEEMQKESRKVSSKK